MQDSCHLTVRVSHILDIIAQLKQKYNLNAVIFNIAVSYVLEKPLPTAAVLPQIKSEVQMEAPQGNLKGKTQPNHHFPMQTIASIAPFRTGSSYIKTKLCIWKISLSYAFFNQKRSKNQTEWRVQKVHHKYKAEQVVL